MIWVSSVSPLNILISPHVDLMLGQVETTRAQISRELKRQRWECSSQQWVCCIAGVCVAVVIIETYFD